MTMNTKFPTAIFTTLAAVAVVAGIGIPASIDTEAAAQAERDRIAAAAEECTLLILDEAPSADPVETYLACHEHVTERLTGD